MSANVIMLTQLKKVQPVNSCKKVSILPNLFSNLLKQYKEKQDEIKKKKINFLMQEAYRYFYDLLEFPKLSDVDLPEFIYDEQRKRIAYQKASKALIDVIAEGRLEKCYSARVKELRNLRSVMSEAQTRNSKNCASDNAVKRVANFCEAIFQDKSKI